MDSGEECPIRLFAKEGLRYHFASEDIYVSDVMKEKADTSSNLKHSIPKIMFKVLRVSLKLVLMVLKVIAQMGLRNQLLHTFYNKRIDGHGSSIENRAIFSLEVVDALIEAIGMKKVTI